MVTLADCQRDACPATSCGQRRESLHSLGEGACRRCYIQAFTSPRFLPARDRSRARRRARRSSSARPSAARSGRRRSRAAPTTSGCSAATSASATTPARRTTPTRVLMAYAIDGYYLNGGSTAYVLRAMDDGDDERRDRLPRRRRGELARALGQLGLRRVPRVRRRRTTDRFRIAVVYESPETGERSLVETWDRLSTEHDDENYVVDVLKRSLYIRWTELDAGVAPVAPAPDDIGSPPARSRGERHRRRRRRRSTAASAAAATLTAAEYGPILADRLAGVDDAALLVAACDALLTDSAAVPATTSTSSSASPRAGRDRTSSSSATCRASGRPATRPRRRPRRSTVKDGLTASNFAGLYWPHLVVGDLVGVGRNPTITLPPAGYVAGLFARIDGRRGVWKAPAGTEATLNGDDRARAPAQRPAQRRAEPQGRSTRCARSRAPGASSGARGR